MNHSEGPKGNIKKVVEYYEFQVSRLTIKFNSQLRQASPENLQSWR